MDSKREKYRLFYKLEEQLEVPMFVLAIVWLFFFILELVKGITATQEYIIYCIWIIFILEFVLKVYLAPRKSEFLKNNIITLIALIIPALRVLRIFYAIRILSSVRLINSTNIIRALTSGKRFFSALKEAQGPQPTPEMNVGFLIASGKDVRSGELEKLSLEIEKITKDELIRSTSIPWFFDIADKIKLEDDNPRSASDFLNRASLKMAEGPYDMVCVITDVPLTSSKNTLQPGLSSKITRMMVISTKHFISTKRRKDSRDLNQTDVKLNISILFLHLTGHILGLKHRAAGDSKIMRPFKFMEGISKMPAFNTTESKLPGKIL